MQFLVGFWKYSIQILLVEDVSKSKYYILIDISQRDDAGLKLPFENMNPFFAS